MTVQVGWSEALVREWLPRAHRLALSGGLAEAQRLLQRLLALVDEPAIRLSLAKVQAQAGDTRAALATLEGLLDRQPADRDALALRKCLLGGEPSRRRRTAAWGAGAGLAAVLALLAAGFDPTDRGEGAAPGAGHEATTQTEPRALRTGQPSSRYLSFAALWSELQRVPETALLELMVFDEPEGLRVGLRGAVPSQWVHDRVIERVRTASDVKHVDSHELLVDPRYVIRRGDTLEGVAIRLYGRADRWAALWSRNQAQIPELRRLRPGMTIDVP